MIFMYLSCYIKRKYGTGTQWRSLPLKETTSTGLYETRWGVTGTQWRSLPLQEATSTGLHETRW